jgi:uncharacterized protein (UPF0332 family)
LSYEELLSKGLIKPITVSPLQVKSRLDLARRDIKAAHTMAATDSDWAYSMAYNAILQATRALMFANGFRPASGPAQHKTAVLFAETALGESFKDEIYLFEKMRSKRHKVTYDVTGLISKDEAAQALEFAVRFLEKIELLLADMVH